MYTVVQVLLEDCGIRGQFVKIGFSPSTIWVPGIQLKSSSLAANASPAEPSLWPQANGVRDSKSKQHMARALVKASHAWITMTGAHVARSDHTGKQEATEPREELALPRFLL